MERDYKELKGCEICFKAFSIGRVRHKCKRCKLIICSDCGKTKSIIIGYKQAPAVPHRVCNICRDDINGQEDIRRRFGTSWGTLSSLAIEWLNKCHVLKELNFKGTHNYKKYLEESNTETDVKNIVNDLVDELSQGRADRESFNYSLTEFLYYSQQGKDKDSVRKSVENVLRAFYARYPELGHTTLLINVAVVLLCFADEETAFYLLCYLKEKLLPESYWDLFSSPLPYLGLLKEKYIIQKTAYNILNADHPKPNMKHFEIVFNKVANVLLGGLLVDVVNFKVQFYVWNDVFTQNTIRPVEICALKILKHSKKYYEEFHRMTLYNFRIFACRNIHEDALRNDPLDLGEETKARASEEFENNVVAHILMKKERLLHALQILKSISPQDVSLVMDRIRRLIQDARSQKKSNTTSIDLSEPDFLTIFNGLESLQQLGENDIVSVYEAIDVEKEGSVPSRVLAGLIILLVSDDLGSKLTAVFSLFDNNNYISQKEVPQLLAFLSEVLPVMNEINSGYLNFHVHLYEMIEKLKKRVKKADKIIALDFQKVVSRYPVFQVITGEKKNFGRSTSMLSYVSMTTGGQDDGSSISDKEPLNEQDFENILDEQVVEKIIDKEHEEAERKMEEERAQYIIENESPQIISDDQKKSESESIIDNNSPAISPELYSSHDHHHRIEEQEARTPVEVQVEEKVEIKVEEKVEIKVEPVMLGSRFGIQLMAPPPVLYEQREEEREVQREQQREQQRELEQKIEKEEKEVKQLIQEVEQHDHHNNHYHVEVHSPPHEEPKRQEQFEQYVSEVKRAEELAEEIEEIAKTVEVVVEQVEIINKPFGNALLDLPREEINTAFINEEIIYKKEEEYEVIRIDEQKFEEMREQTVASYGRVIVEEVIKVDERRYETNHEGVIVEVAVKDESYLAKGNTADNTEVDIEQNEFLNEPKIKQQISAADRKVVNRDTSSAIERDNGCKLCNMF